MSNAHKLKIFLNILNHQIQAWNSFHLKREKKSLWTTTNCHSYCIDNDKEPVWNGYGQGDLQFSVFSPNFDGCRVWIGHL